MWSVDSGNHVGVEQLPHDARVPKKTAGAWGLLTLQLVVLPNQVRHRCEEVDEARLHTAPPVPLSLTGRPCAAVCRNVAVSGVRVGPA